MTHEPQWLYRIEALSPEKGLWYNDSKDWVFEKGIGLVDAPSRDLPMEHDHRYQKDDRDWHSSAPSSDLMKYWFSRENVEYLLDNGFQFYRYLATEYIHYEFETCFIKETCLKKELVDYTKVWNNDSNNLENTNTTESK